LTKRKKTFLEFFAGGGMARVGLGGDWECLFANDVDPAKCAAYRANFGGADLVEGSVESVAAKDLPRERADLAWASFPCQDLSLAGERSGIGAERSGMFFEFWRLITALKRARRAPRLIVIENVPGLLTSNAGADLAQIAALMSGAGYSVGGTIIDAAAFTPQSRPRVFIVGFSKNAPTRLDRQSAVPDLPAPIARRLPGDWIHLPSPIHRRNVHLEDIVDWNAETWDASDKTRALLDMMSALQRNRLETIKRSGARRAGAGFRRMRTANGKSVQRFEARFDGIAGCLRTPAGGSSRQILIAMDKGNVRTRLLNPVEAARLMGLPEDYRLPTSTAAALKLCGDGVSVPAVRWLAENILEPALEKQRAKAA
jgi:DNA (cytosine-5)-methyltransferase 1